jgi:hypothetical protein
MQRILLILAPRTTKKRKEKITDITRNVLFHSSTKSTSSSSSSSPSSPSSSSSSPSSNERERETTARNTNTQASCDSIARSVYREILRQCAGNTTTTTTTTTTTNNNNNNNNNKNNVSLRIRLLLANNLRERFRETRDSTINNNKGEEKERAIARTISIWTFIARANAEKQSIEYSVLKNLIRYYDLEQKRTKRNSKQQESKKVLRTLQELESIEEEFNTFCVEPLLDIIKGGSDSDKNNNNNKFVFDISRQSR